MGKIFDPGEENTECSRSKLQLIVTDSSPEPERFKGDSSHSASPDRIFSFQIKEDSETLYTFEARDFRHDLHCQMVLEVKEPLGYSEEEGSSVSCDFPTIDTKKFNEKVWWDEYLQGMLMLRFQLRILEQLLLFCEEQAATSLIIRVNDNNIDYLGVFDPYADSIEETIKGEMVEAVIPTDVGIYDEVIDFIDRIEKDFRKELWREQGSNTAFRAYLKKHPLFQL
jgi:hypothetical protein